MPFRVEIFSKPSSVTSGWQRAVTVKHRNDFHHTSECAHLNTIWSLAQAYFLGQPSDQQFPWAQSMIDFREFKHARFWATHANQKRGLLHFNMSICYQIFTAKCLSSWRDDLSRRNQYPRIRNVLFWLACVAQKQQTRDQSLSQITGYNSKDTRYRKSMKQRVGRHF